MPNPSKPFVRRLNLFKDKWDALGRPPLRGLSPIGKGRGVTGICRWVSSIWLATPAGGMGGAPVVEGCAVRRSKVFVGNAVPASLKGRAGGAFSGGIEMTGVFFSK